MKTVDAASRVEVDMIHAILIKKYPCVYADIWKTGCNLSLRIGDLLSLVYENLDIPGRKIKLIEQKTGKIKIIRLNSVALSIIERRKSEYPSDTWLFQNHSNRSSNCALSRVSVARVFKAAGDNLGLSIGTHSMRKSRGAIMFSEGVSIEKIAKVLNHSNTSSTLRYLGITQESVLQTYDDYQL